MGKGNVLAVCKQQFFQIMTLHSLPMSCFNTVQQLSNSLKKVSDSPSLFMPGNWLDVSTDWSYQLWIEKLKLQVTRFHSNSLLASFWGWCWDKYLWIGFQDLLIFCHWSLCKAVYAFSLTQVWINSRVQCEGIATLTLSDLLW